MDHNEFQLLPGDFTGLEADLTPEEKGLITDLRSYLERDVRPVIDEHWEAATFPREIVAGLASAGVVGLAFEETRPFVNSAVFRGGPPSSSLAWMPASLPTSACRTAWPSARSGCAAQPRSASGGCQRLLPARSSAPSA